MDLNYSSEETDRSSSSDDDAGSGRSFECIFCKRGFTTAQALGGHMNIHRKERAADKSNNKPTFPPSTSHPNFSDLSFHSQSPSPSHSNSTPPRVQAYFPATTTRGTPSHLQYRDQLLCVENQRDAQDYWRKRSSLCFYANPLCADEIGDKFEESSSEDRGLDLELRLGNFP